ncbi:phage holin family protein [Psychromicrobium xiongbiense]|uniref:phage holin family protein n=1 Tax=Psychromicrobium xiongbiense TaxID=3051184 RepID=UPI0025574860|nr:phage holin family protein [Psychromicrobium sp. YIM S02556]
MSETPALPRGADGGASLVGNVRTLAQLTPRQINDEVTLALRELKAKGINLGVAVGLFVAALLFLSFALVALIVAAIMGLATVMPAWLSALIFAVFFLLVVGLGALIGLRYVKKAMPLTPDEAIRGVKHDLGVLKDGASFDVASLERSEADDAAAAEAKREAKQSARKGEDAAEPAPTDAELRQRIAERRSHLLNLREELAEQVDVKKQAQKLLDDPESPVNQVRQRWVPLTVAAVSTTTLLVLLRKLLKK